MKVWKRGHKGCDPLHPKKLCNPVAEARLVSYWYTFVTFSLLSVLSHLQFASPWRKSISKKWSKNTAKASTMRKRPLMVGPSMIAKAEKHMDSEIDALFYLALWMWDTIPLTTIDSFFLKVCSIWWGVGLQGGNVAEAKFVFHVFWSYGSCISDTLKLWCMENQLRMTQDVLARVGEYLQRTYTSVLDGKK
jgi:hypothetical protein